jgi:AcrR family transcriptional regulator
LVDAAEKVLADKGFAHLTIRAVAAEAGVAPMGVYNRFGNKAGLVDALFARGFQLLRESTIAVSGVGVVRLRKACLAYRQFALSHRHLYQLMFNMPDDVVPSEPSMELAGLSFTELVLRVSEAMAAGDLAGSDALEGAQVLWSALHGAVSLEIVGIGFTPDVSTTYEDLVDTMLAGMAVSR